MEVGAKVCELTGGFLWFVCGNFDLSPYLKRCTVLPSFLLSLLNYLVQQFFF